MVKAQKYILAKQFEGDPKDGDLQIVEEELPPIYDGEIVVEAVWLYVDTHMRAYAPILSTGSIMIETEVAKVPESTVLEFQIGQHVVRLFGWRTKTSYIVTKLVI